MKTGHDNDEEQDLEFEAFDELDTSNSKRLNPTYNDRINEFLAKCDLQMTDAQFYLYKYENYMSGEAKSLVNKYLESEPPDEHEVGLQYGSGRYILMMYIPPIGKSGKQMRGYRFRINPIYDERRAGGGGSNNQQPMIIQQQQRPDDSLIKALGLFQGMMQSTLSMLIPVLKPPETPDMTKIMNRNYSVLDGVMRQSMESSIKMFDDYQRKLLQIKQTPRDNDGGNNMQMEEEQPTGVFEVIGQIMPLLEEWLPKLLGGGPRAIATKELIQGTKMFKEIKRNRLMLNALIQHLDNTQGTEETDKILQVLKIGRNIPSSRPSIPQNSGSLEVPNGTTQRINPLKRKRGTQ